MGTPGVYESNGMSVDIVVIVAAALQRREAFGRSIYPWRQFTKTRWGSIKWVLARGSREG